MRKLIVLLFLIAASASISVHASIYGILAGKVVDTDGKGVLGATVLIKGTTRGTKVNSRDGSFTVSNIQAGSYTVSVRSIGKQEYNVPVRISADQTTTISVVLKDDAVQMDTVVVLGEATSKKVDDTQQGSIATMDNEELVRQSGTNLASVVALSAGVQSSDDGFSIRGGRSSETQIRIDGIKVGDQFTGGFGAGGSTYYPMVSTYATEQVQVITGNFAAEYGEAMGGVVNTVIRTGRTDRFDGHLDWNTDLGFLYGSQASGIDIEKIGANYSIVDEGDGAALLNGNYNSIDFGIGGPLKFLNDKSTFYITGNYYFNEYGGVGYDIADPWGRVRARQDNNSIWRKNLVARLKFGITDNIALLVGGQYGLTNRELFSGQWMYDDDIGTPYINADGQIDPLGKATPNSIPQRIAKSNVYNNYVGNIMARLNHTLTDRSFYEITLGLDIQNQETGRRNGWNDPGFISGFELMRPVDDWIVEGSQFLPANDNDGKMVGDKVIDWASPTSYSDYSKDTYCYGTWQGINPLTGYYEGAPYNSSTINPWGITPSSMGTDYYSGGATAFDYRYSNTWQAQGNYNLFNVKTGDFSHNLKAGFEFNLLVLNRHYNSAPYNGNPVYDIYTGKWGGNIYADSLDEYNKTSEAKNLMKLGVYVQDQISYKGIIFSPGLRIDVLDPMSQYRVMGTGQPQFVPISSDSGFADASVKFQLSPRININYPITERSYVSISYGLFFQSPEANYLYDRFNAENISTGGTPLLGDPNMDAQQTNQYQVSYQNMLTDELKLVLTAYYKDIYNQLGVTQVMTSPDPYFQYSVSEYGTSKGIEVGIAKFLSNNFAFDLNYTFSYLEVTSTGPNSNTTVLRDPYSGKLTFPLAPYPSSDDIRHRVKGSASLLWGNGEGPSVGGFLPLQNSYLTLTPSWRSGVPYTRTNIGGMATSERNAYRGPSVWNVDAKIEKGFYLKEWFGEGLKNAKIDVYVNIYNVFNDRSANNFYTTTGDPDDDGRSLTTKQAGNFVATPWYKTASYVKPESYSVDQYDQYGNRLYSADADFDGNGIVTQEEKYQAYLKYEEYVISFRSNYKLPIRVAAGIVFRF